MNVIYVYIVIVKLLDIIFTFCTYSYFRTLMFCLCIGKYNFKYKANNISNV